MNHEPTSKILKREDQSSAMSLEDRLQLAESSGAGSLDAKVISPQDLKDRELARGILQEAKSEADAIRQRARDIYRQVEEKVKEAREAGFKQGREEGLATVTELQIKIKNEQAKTLSGLEKQAVSLVYEIARKMIGDTFAASPEALAGMVRQALSASMGNELTVLLNPVDYEKLKSLKSQLAGALHGSQVLNLRPAETVKQGGCVIESEMGTVEADWDHQLKAIRQALEIDGEDHGDGA